MATRATIDRLTERVDAVARRRGGGPLWCVCGTLQEGRDAVDLHLAARPQDRARTIHIVATGVAPGMYGPATVREMTP
jgi:hypothetical protein